MSTSALAAAVDDLERSIALPTVSADRRATPALDAHARWLADRLRSIGLEHVRLVGGGGPRVVVADWLHQPNAPTVVLYGHYDVVSAAPVAEWNTTPYRAVQRGRRIYGRGAADDKGPLLMQVRALGELLARTGSLPVNVRCLYEGEEEVGSPHLAATLQAMRPLPRADVVVVCDTEALPDGRPTLTISQRGQLSVELQLDGLPSDVHGGRYGGAVHNPAQVLAEIIAGLHDDDGRIAIPGFYDDVRAAAPAPCPSSAELLASVGVARSHGERGHGALARATTRPALIVNGLRAGHTGPGPKHLIPSSATAKLNIRIVPDQSPRVVEAQLRRHLSSQVPGTMQLRVRTELRTEPWTAGNVKHPAYRAARQALTFATGMAPCLVRSGGTVPAVSVLARALRPAAILQIGLSPPSTRAHAPNEHISVDQLRATVVALCRLLELLGAMP